MHQLKKEVIRKFFKLLLTSELQDSDRKKDKLFMEEHTMVFEEIWFDSDFNPDTIEDSRILRLHWVWDLIKEDKFDVQFTEPWHQEAKNILERMDRASATELDQIFQDRHHLCDIFGNLLACISFMYSLAKRERKIESWERVLGRKLERRF